MPPKRQDFSAKPGSEDFKRQADEYTLDGAKGVLKSLQARKKAMVQPIEQEIAFVENVIKYKEENQ